MPARNPDRHAALRPAAARGIATDAVQKILFSAVAKRLRAGMVEVLLSLQPRLEPTCVLVSHDLALVRQLADTASVMQRGRMVEDGTVAEVFGNPRQARITALVESIPSGVAGWRGAYARLARGR